MEMKELVGLLIVVFVLIVMLGVVLYFTESGGSVLSSIKNFLRFG